MRKLLFAAAFLILGAAAVVVPLPFLALTPGPVEPIAGRIDLATSDLDELEGELVLTSVAIENPTTVEVASMLVDDERELVSRRRVVPPGVDADEFARRQREIFRESMRVAAAVGQRAAGHEVTVEGEGARVVTILPGAPAEDALENGDGITAVDDREVRLASELSGILASHQAGDTVRLTVERDDEEQTVEVELDEIDRLEQPGLGVAVQTRNRTIRLAVELEVDAEDIGGPSAGLMAALTVFDLLDDGDLLRGRTVAGTGTIAPSGRVGPLGGVTQKVTAAIDHGADLFLVPDELADDARDAADGAIEIVPVEDFDGALAQLRDASG